MKTNNSILPKASIKWEHVFDRTIHEKLLSSESYRIKRLGEIKNIFNFSQEDEIPKHFLDRLARNFKIEYWDNSFDEKRKRKLLKAGLNLNKTAGSLSCIKKIFEIFSGVGGENFRQWFDEKKDENINKAELPVGSLEISIKQDLNKEQDLNKKKESLKTSDLMRLLDAYKPLHTKLVFYLKIHFELSRTITGFVKKRSYRKLYLESNSRRKMFLKIKIIGFVKKRSYRRVKIG